MDFLNFKTTLLEIKGWLIVQLPTEISIQLPTRGMVMVEGTLNGAPFTAPLEPDGMGSHWFRVTDDLSMRLNIRAGDAVALSIVPLSTWPQPDVPEDLAAALETHDLMAAWQNITTKARWEWIRWIRFTANPKTRQKRIDITCSKLEAGKKRPCCFDQSRCTETAVSKSGILQIDANILKHQASE